MLGVDAPRDRVLTLAGGRLFLVEAKRLSDTSSSLSQHMPEAVSQALALCELTRYSSVQYHHDSRNRIALSSCSSQDTVRFCLSNGHSWIFAILKVGVDGQRAYYQAPPWYLDKAVVQSQSEESLRSVQVIVELVLEWASALQETLRNCILILTTGISSFQPNFQIIYMNCPEILFSTLCT